jgi:hypothetical protein
VERVVGHTEITAFWASQTFQSEDPWSRIQTALKECLYIDEWLLSEDTNKIRWIADTLEITGEYFAAEPFPFVRVEIEVFQDFESPEDGIFLASNLNHKATGGAFIYVHNTNSVKFSSYCTTLVWWDFALLLNSLRTIIGQCELLSRKESVLRFNKCKSGSSIHPKLGARENPHPLFISRLDDVAQIDYIGGLYLSHHERVQVFEAMLDECKWAEFQQLWDDENPGRTIDRMDFAFQIFPESEFGGVLNDYSAFASVKFNEWTDYGRSISINLGLPLFTWPGIFDDGASHEEAVRLANLLNLAAHELCWQKIGLGCWWAKGSQICFSMDIPHTWIKPILTNIVPTEVGEAIFDFINPNMLHRMFNIALRELNAIGVKTQRDPGDMDMHPSILGKRRKIDFVRCADNSASKNAVLESYWDMPSRPLMVYGIFNPVGSTLGSIEIGYSNGHAVLLWRWRHSVQDEEQEVADLVEMSTDGSDIRNAIENLAQQMSLPDFIHIPDDCPANYRSAVLDGIQQMASAFSNSGVDLKLKAARIATQANPWWRKGTSEPITEGDDLTAFNDVSDVEAYLSEAMNPFVVDINLGLFHAWWAGAITWVGEPDNPDKATQIVENLTQHVITRESGQISE